MMADLTEEKVSKMIDDAVDDERERCAALAEALAVIWDDSAKRIREKGTFTTRQLWPPPFRKVSFVLPSFEMAASDLEAAAGGVRRALVHGIRAGWKPLPDEHSRAELQDDPRDIGPL